MEPYKTNVTFYYPNMAKKSKPVVEKKRFYNLLCPHQTTQTHILFEYYIIYFNIHIFTLCSLFHKHISDLIF